MNRYTQSNWKLVPFTIVFAIDVLSVFSFYSFLFSQKEGYAQLTTEIISGNLLYKHDIIVYFGYLPVFSSIHTNIHIYSSIRLLQLNTFQHDHHSVRRAAEMNSRVSTINCADLWMALLTFSFDRKYGDVLWISFLLLSNELTATLCPIQLQFSFVHHREPSSAISSKSLTTYCSFLLWICLFTNYGIFHKL